MIYETVADLKNRLASLPDNQIILCPQLWTKADAELEFYESTEIKVVLTDEQWITVIDHYYSDDYATYETLVDAVTVTVNAQFDRTTHTWKLPEETK